MNRTYTPDNVPLLSAEERRRLLVETLRRELRINVREISAQLGVSEVTVRADLDVLEREGLAQRVWGGAVLPAGLRHEPAFAARLKQHREAKQRIAAAAARLIADGDSIILDASSTAFYLAPHLKQHRDLTVITNGVHLALELAPHEQITTILIGGILRGRNASLVGVLGEEMLSKLYASKGFFSARGLSTLQGLSERHIPEAQLKAAMVQRVEQVIAILDASKLEQTSLTSFCPFERIDRLITAGPADPEVLARFAAAGLTIEHADPGAAAEQAPADRGMEDGRSRPARQGRG
jgi:DeoR/GlpR family transcriptional regulator of sugar metabolism